MPRWLPFIVDPKDYDRNIRWIRTIETIFCVIALVAAPFAAIVPFGLAREGLWAQLFLPESLFYLGVLAYPVLFLVATVASSRFERRGRRAAAGACQAAPVLLIAALGLLVRLQHLFFRQ
jgi:hypothetical protein